ncbi:MAG: DUF4038 domain-containing protein [Chloroflexia bacterium]
MLSIPAAAADDSLLLYRYTREGLDKYLEQCVAKGVRRLSAVILPEGDPKPNAYGEYAMGYGGQGHLDVSLPNPAFFQHLDWVVKRAGSKGIELGLLPVEATSKLAEANSAGSFFDWGRYLGRRYMKAKGLVWLREKKQPGGPLTELEAGIRQFDSVHRFEP